MDNIRAIIKKLKSFNEEAHHQYSLLKKTFFFFFFFFFVKSQLFGQQNSLLWIKTLAQRPDKKQQDLSNKINKDH